MHEGRRGTDERLEGAVEQGATVDRDLDRALARSSDPVVVWRHGKEVNLARARLGPRGERQRGREIHAHEGIGEAYAVDPKTGASGDLRSRGGGSGGVRSRGKTARTEGKAERSDNDVNECK